MKSELKKAGRELSKNGDRSAAKILGKVGGKVKSPLKALTARRNGRKHVAENE